MDEIIEILKEDLAFQKKKLSDLIAWGSDEVLINEQNAIIHAVEKKIEAPQAL